MQPPNRPFPHTAECRTPDADPQWTPVGELHWEQVCSCHTAHFYGQRDRPAPPPDSELEAFIHGLDPDTDQPCDGVARLRWNANAEDWRIECRMCGSTTVYFPYRRRVQADGSLEPLPVGTRLVS